MPPANSSNTSTDQHRVVHVRSKTPSRAEHKSTTSNTPSRAEHKSMMTQHATNQVHQHFNRNWISGTDVAHVHQGEQYSNSQNVKYSLSTTSTGFDLNEVTSGTSDKNKKKRDYKFKNSTLSDLSANQQTDMKKSTSLKHATCHQHYILTSQKSLDLDDFAQDFFHHTHFKLLDVNDETLNSTTILQINPNHLNRRLTTLKRGADSISKKEILRVLHLNQQQASLRLGCSVSTLKRKFYSLRKELGLSKWPNNYIDSCEKNPELFKQIYPLSLSFILNSD